MSNLTSSCWPVFFKSEATIGFRVDVSTKKSSNFDAGFRWRFEVVSNLGKISRGSCRRASGIGLELGKIDLGRLRRDSTLSRSMTVDVDGAENRFFVELSIWKLVVGFWGDALSSPKIILGFWCTWKLKVFKKIIKKVIAKGLWVEVIYIILFKTTLWLQNPKHIWHLLYNNQIPRRLGASSLKNFNKIMYWNHLNIGTRFLLILYIKHWHVKRIN